MKPWKVERQEYLVKDQWITLRADRCVTESGAELDPYYVLEYRDWVYVVPFDDQQRVLLTRLYRHGNRQINLEIPAGCMEPHEEDPARTARRELLEETGHEAERLVYLGGLTPNSATHTNQIHCFAAYGVKQVAEPCQDETEDIEFEFCPIDDLVRMIDDGTFRQALHIAAIYLALRDKKQAF
jgi:8-oxo-dGTP pyrophosphatase MutT (NUDIX family)